MATILHRLRAAIAEPLGLAAVVALGFVFFLTADQQHWWRMKPDYAFGWLVPFFVFYIVYERLGKLRALLAAAGDDTLPRGSRRLLNAAFGLIMAGGLGIFLFGALYRAGSGPTQPGSLALAVGFMGSLIGMVYFNVPSRTVPLAGGLRSDARLRAVALFVFPAAIWVLSAPLLSAVENSISLFLLRRVISIVFALFSLLGLPLVQEGNVLILPQGQVGVADACSGIRSLMACLFAGSFLAAVFLDRFWKKALLVFMALALAFLTNLLRSLFLTSWAYRYGSEAIEGTLHDATGYAVLGLTCVALFCLLPLFSSANWQRWLGLAGIAGCESASSARS